MQRSLPARLGLLGLLALFAACQPPQPAARSGSALGQNSSAIQTVFVVVMENHSWNDIKGADGIDYINKTLLPQASYADQYYTAPGIHPSLPNYLWLEAGTNFGITNDNDPSSNHQGTSAHLTALLDGAGISWRAYQEGISGNVCPLKSTGKYVPKHNPFVYFDDETDNQDPNSANCIANNRPYDELAGDLANYNVAQYNFITPDLCHDMHDLFGCDSFDPDKNGDKWLSQEIPKILNSQVYQDGGALFIVWDEGGGFFTGSDGPLGMIVLSPFAKGGGYHNSIHYTHSSTLRTMQEIFGVTPLLGDAANAASLSDLFTTYP